MNDPSLYHTPPHALEMEDELLSACLIDPAVAVDASELLTPADFYKTAHRKIFHRICRQVSEKKPTDLPSIVSALRDSDELEACGGAAYISNLVNDVPVAANIEHYCNVIRQKKQLRQIIEQCNAATKSAFNDDITVIDRHLAEISKIASGQKESGFKHISEIMEDTITRCEKMSQANGVTGVPSGYPDLDFITCGFQPSDLIIIAGRPGMGKTALALNLIKNQCRKKYNIAFFSLEMANPQIGSRMASMVSNIEGNKFRSGRFSKTDWATLTNAASHISEWGLHVDDTAKLTYQSLIRRARQLHSHVGLSALYIDYLGFVDGDKDLGRRDLEVGSITRNLKAFAKDSGIPVVLLVQLSRKCEERGNKRPLLSDLRDSGDIEQDADLVMFVYRDELYYEEKSKHKGEAEILIRKQRNGTTGTVGLKWIGQNTRFESLETDHEQ